MSIYQKEIYKKEGEKGIMGVSSCASDVSEGKILCSFTCFLYSAKLDCRNRNR